MNRNPDERGDSTLKQFLQYRRDADVKGPPPTATASLLMTILVGKEASKKPVAKIDPTSQNLAHNQRNSDLIPASRDRRSFQDKENPLSTADHSKIIPSNRLVTNGGLWSNVNVANTNLGTFNGMQHRELQYFHHSSHRSSSSTNKYDHPTISLSSVSTIDDLVGPREEKKSAFISNGYNKSLSNINRRKRNMNAVSLSLWSNTRDWKSNHLIQTESIDTYSNPLTDMTASISVDKNKSPTMPLQDPLHSIETHRSLVAINSLVHKDPTLIESPLGSSKNVSRTIKSSYSTNFTPAVHLNTENRSENIHSSSFETSSDLYKGNEVRYNMEKDSKKVELKTLIPKGSSLVRSQDEPRLQHKDNFVRLNLRNRAGACRGAKNLRRHNKMKRRRIEESQNRQSSEARSTVDLEKPVDENLLRPRNISLHTVIDPIDDFLDGTFHKMSTASSLECIPVCTRHNLPCKLLKVKKASSGNKGRRFYVCPLPQYDACNFFQWEDDTVEVCTGF